MENSRKTEALIKKLNKIYKNGYVPSRESVNYILHTLTVNCFGHACFNLADEDLEKLAPYTSELKSFFQRFDAYGAKDYIKVASEKLNQVGLKMQKSSISDSIQKNQWKVACYMMCEEQFGGGFRTDMHFIIQGKDGKWYSKMGKNSSVDVFDKLPKSISKSYTLQGVYKITNPYVKLDSEENMDM